MRSTFQNVWFWVAVVLLTLFLWKSCGKGNVSFFGCNKADTLSHKIDTVIRKTKDSISYVPVPYRVDSIVYIPKWYETIVYNDMTPENNNHPEYNEVSDTCSKLLTDYNILSDDYNKLFKKYVARVYYDTIWNGIRVRDTVQRNRIIGRKITSEISDTTIKEETILLKRKFIVYAGAQVFGSKSDLFRGGFATLSFKGKNDVQFDLGIGRIRGIDGNQYMIGIKTPIRLFNIKTKKK